MNIESLDLFSSEFQFNIGPKYFKRNTIVGLILSFLAVTMTFSYAIYLFYLNFSNQINPKFQSQSFIKNDRIEVPFDNDLVGFQFMYNFSMSIDQYQQSLNQTYLIYVAQLYYQDPKNNIYNVIDLDTFQCTTPQLQGFICIDFSNVSNYTFLLDNSDNNQVYSSLFISLYGCNDQDQTKTTVPNNCPAQNDIDNIIDGDQAYFQLKLKTQQYNTTSRKMQTNYRNLYNYVASAQFVLNSLSAQKQETNVDSGLLFQQRQTYSSPIQYTLTTQSFDRTIALKTGVGPYSKQILLMDEIVQQFEIQYPTITEILALINAVAGLIFVFRIVGKFYSYKLIKQDFFMLMLQNLYQDNYRKIIIHNNLIKNQENIFSLISEKTEKDEVEVVDEVQEDCIKKDIIVPDFPTKLRDYVEKSQYLSQNNNNNNGKFHLKLNDQLNEENEKIDSNRIIVNLKKNFQNTEESVLNLKNQTSIDHSDFPNYEINTPNAESKSKKLILFQTERNQQKEQNDQDIIKIDNKQQNQLSNYQNKMKQKNLYSCQQIGSQKYFLSSPKTQNQQKSVAVFQSRSLFNTRQSNNINNRESIQQDLSQSQKKEILKESAFQNFKSIQSNSLKQIIKNTIFKFKKFKSKIFFQERGIDCDYIKYIEQEVNKSLDIYDLYKDIIFLKKAIMMILSEEQLAAIQFVTLTEQFQSLYKISNISDEQINNIRLNYFEKQICIQNSQILQEEYLKKFFIKQQQEIQQQDVIDQRIFSSLVKY
ncbi:transmembrane protein, putative (macronuclear) [Tetrahymena thermophila SB210]|uniref:Transmembrane protein, putative n=1 Tax=Tetrahymena thermophila (strain SB210) TaxID=312017 RepID=W7XH26_TETTS|nr:transmembrane protein, putative [Tetrahymena thermophila SB210]EWS76423.1 transmembrane protein, putative [Tetrahymena thermophila SB210]|eukprot:XP_012651047.1 transmembrane protein, putative [Tetrahymena thermophila SB210]